MYRINDVTNSAKTAYNTVQAKLQPLREGRGTLNGTIVTHTSAMALGLASVLYACDKISAKIPLALASVQLGSWFVYGNKMYTRNLPRMNEMIFGKVVVGEPKADPATGKWEMNSGTISKLSQTYFGKGTPAHWQFFNKGLCYDGLIPWFNELGAKTILDVGCGEQASYVKAIAQKGFYPLGMDLNLSPTLPLGTAVVGNALQPFPKEIDQKFDVVLSIEAGAKLPKGSEEIYIANLVKHANKAIFCSWPVPGQEGPHQNNRLTNDQVTAIFNKYGWVRDTDREVALKAAADGIDFWFQNTTMAFVPA